MASRGRGRRGRPRGTGQAPPLFDQQAFVEVVGIATAAIAQAGIAGSQGGLSNLQRFRAHHPPTFTGGGCHTPIPDPTRMADPNRVRGVRLSTGTH